jgi:hypothetical protein
MADLLPGEGLRVERPQTPGLGPEPSPIQVLVKSKRISAARALGRLPGGYRLLCRWRLTHAGGH